jgi:hypothetical protein
MKHLHYQTRDSATLRLRNLKAGNHITVTVVKSKHRGRNRGKRRHLVVSLPDTVEIVIDESGQRQSNSN